MVKPAPLKFRIVELADFSGRAATIYSVIVGEDIETVFEKFFSHVEATHPQALDNIVGRLYDIGKTRGAQEIFFKEKEGKLGDGVCALYDYPNSELRLYCITYGKFALILSGGGPKGEGVRAWQDDPVLAQYANLMIGVSKIILQAIRDKDLFWKGNRLQGKLKFGYEDDEED